MLTRADIRDEATAASYRKGVDVFSANKVEEFAVDESLDKFDYIEARVKGSGRKHYSVSLTVNKEEDWVEESFCQCPAFDNYTGICKHCVAVLLEYIERKKREVLSARELEKQAVIRERLAMIPKGSSIWKEPVKETNVQLKNLLIQQNVRRTLPLIQDQIYGRVQIEPHLKFQNGEPAVDFKIGHERMYVVKDVFSFCTAVEDQRKISYGKSLEFVHMEEAFAEESRPLLRFLMEWTAVNAQNYRKTSGYGYYRSWEGPQVLRNVPLKNADLGRFLKALGDKEIYVEEARYSEIVYRCTKEKMSRRMTITGADGGIYLKLLHPAGFCGPEYYVYFQGRDIYLEKTKELEPIKEFLECVEGIEGKGAYIAQVDIPTFCRELYPIVEEYYDIENINFQPEEYGAQEAEFRFYLDAPQMDLIQIKVMAAYGDKEFSVYKPAAVSDNRDVIKEAKIARLASSYCNAFDERNQCVVISDDEDRVYELLTDGIPRFQEYGEVMVSDELKKFSIKTAPKVTVGISLSGNLLELSMTAGDMPKDELIEILSRYDRRKKYYRLKSGEFVQTEAADFDALMELRQGLQLTDQQLAEDQIQIPKYRALYLDAELREHQGVSAQKNRDFRSLIRNMKTVEDNDFEIPSGLDSTLREYQKRGYLWIKTLKFNGFGGILADDMGLGKTLQVICFFQSEYQEEEKKPSLVVTPASLVFNWKQELERFAPEIPVRMIVGNAAERKDLLEEAKNGEILLTSYDLLRRDLEHYKGMKFENQIIDEAQYIKNHGTQAARAVKTIHAEFKLALTGTPVENKLSELWSIFDYLMPGFLYTYKKFRDEMETRIVQNQDEYAAQRLQKMIRPFVLRRLKKDVLTDLPDKMEENYYAKLEGEQQKLYDAHVQRMKLMLDKQSDEEFRQSKIQILSELTRLRQICCDPSLAFEGYQENSSKLDLCVNLISNAVSGGHKILLFSQFTTMLEHLQERLKAEEISFYSLTGATSKEQRLKLVDAFNRDDTSVFCISLKAGGTGLNLTSADIVIHYDPWWNIAVQNQATDRAHRIGQKNIVSVYKLIMKGTIEENIVKLQEKKQELADQILSGDGVGSGSFSKEELIEILGQ